MVVIEPFNDSSCFICCLQGIFEIRYGELYAFSPICSLPLDMVFSFFNDVDEHFDWQYLAYKESAISKTLSHSCDDHWPACKLFIFYTHINYIVIYLWQESGNELVFLHPGTFISTICGYLWPCPYYCNGERIFPGYGAHRKRVRQLAVLDDADNISNRRSPRKVSNFPGVKSCCLYYAGLARYVY